MKTIVVGYDETEPADARARAGRGSRGGVRLAADRDERCPCARRVARDGCRSTQRIRPSSTRRSSSTPVTFLERAAASKPSYELAIGRPRQRRSSSWPTTVGADLIVVGTRQPEPRLPRSSGVSVSGTVKRKAHCDVLIVQ